MPLFYPLLTTPPIYEVYSQYDKCLLHLRISSLFKHIEALRDINISEGFYARFGSS
jgi:hypothetical protein